MEDECYHCGTLLEGSNSLKLIFLWMVSGTNGYYCSIDCLSNARSSLGWIYYGIIFLVVSIVIGQGIFYDTPIMVLVGYFGLLCLFPISIMNFYLSLGIKQVKKGSDEYEKIVVVSQKSCDLCGKPIMGKTFSVKDSKGEIVKNYCSGTCQLRDSLRN